MPDANQETPEQQHQRQNANQESEAKPAVKSKAKPAPQPDISTITTPEQLADPTHPSHAAFHWGRFFAILAAALAVAAPAVQIATGDSRIGAAITGAEQVLGPLSKGFEPEP